MKYIKNYNEDIKWDFDEEETPELNIYNLENYKMYELYEIFGDIDNLIGWLNKNLKGKKFILINDDPSLPNFGDIIYYFKKSKDDFEIIKNISIPSLNKKEIMKLKINKHIITISIFLNDKIKIL